MDWTALRTEATAVMHRAYVPYSNYPVGAAGLVDDGRVVSGCNVENASYGMTLCAECGLVSSLIASGGGRLVAMSCVDGHGAPLMPCGRCRQLLWEHGGPTCLIDATGGPLPLTELLPHAFGPRDLEEYVEEDDPTAVPARLAEWVGRGSVFVHPDVAGGVEVWTAYWERSTGAADDPDPRGVLEEGPTWPVPADAVAWGLARTSRVVVVGADGELAWAGPGEAPSEIGVRWSPS